MIQLQYGEEVKLSEIPIYLIYIPVVEVQDYPTKGIYSLQVRNCPTQNGRLFSHVALASRPPSLCSTSCSFATSWIQSTVRKIARHLCYSYFSSGCLWAGPSSSRPSTRKSRADFVSFKTILMACCDEEVNLESSWS